MPLLRTPGAGPNSFWGPEMGSGAGATFSVVFPNVAKEVRTVSIYFLRSHGDKWKDSLARFTVSSGKDDAAKVVGEHEIPGIHEGFPYSLTLSETIELSEVVPAGGTVTLRAELVGGSTFKIMGMMFCNK